MVVSTTIGKDKKVCLNDGRKMSYILLQDYPNCKYSAPWFRLSIRHASSQLVQELEFLEFQRGPWVQGFQVTGLTTALMMSNESQNLLLTQITVLQLCFLSPILFCISQCHDVKNPVLT